MKTYLLLSLLLAVALANVSAKTLSSNDLDESEFVDEPPRRMLVKRDADDDDSDEEDDDDKSKKPAPKAETPKNSSNNTGNI